MESRSPGVHIEEVIFTGLVPVARRIGVPSNFWLFKGVKNMDEIIRTINGKSSLGVYLDDSPEIKKIVDQLLELNSSLDYTLQEQLTEADAVSNVLTFSEDLSFVEIYNTDTTNIGTFTINGISVKVPPEQTFDSKFGGTPGNTVTITGSTSYIVSRYK